MAHDARPPQLDSNVDRSDQEAIERLRNAGAATVHEALHREGAMDAAIKPIDPRMRIAGRALTVDAAPGDNLMIQYAVSLAQPGDVLVVDAKGFLEAGAWGDMLSVYAQQVGLAGLIIDGSVRDTQDIIALGFPVFSRGVSIKGTGKYYPGAINEPIHCAGVTVHAGDVVVGDADGVTVVPAGDLHRAVELAEAREANEASMRRELRHGARLYDLLGLRDRLTALGFDVDRPKTEERPSPSDAEE